MSNGLGQTLGPIASLSAVNVLDHSMDCVKLIGTDGDIQYINVNGLCAMEIDDIDSLDGRLWSDMWPEPAQVHIASAYTTAKTGDTARFRAFCPTAKGTPRWWDVSVSRVADDAGTHIGYLSVSRDVTEQQISRAALDVSSAELKHRLKNTYAMICSMVTAFARGSPGNEAFALIMRSRLMAIGAAQALFTSGEADCQLQILIPALVDPFDSTGCRVVVDVPTPVTVNQGRADAIALVIGELSVNASKHGALLHGGEITVKVRTTGNQLTIAWHERSNVPPKPTSRPSGQGLDLIQRIVAVRQGTLATEWQASGLTTVLTFPV